MGKYSNFLSKISEDEITKVLNHFNSITNMNLNVNSFVRGLYNIDETLSFVGARAEEKNEDELSIAKKINNTIIEEFKELFEKQLYLVIGNQVKNLSNKEKNYNAEIPNHTFYAEYCSMMNTLFHKLFDGHYLDAKKAIQLQETITENKTDINNNGNKTSDKTDILVIPKEGLFGKSEELYNKIQRVVTLKDDYKSDLLRNDNYSATYMINKLNDTSRKEISFSDIDEKSIVYSSEEEKLQDLMKQYMTLKEHYNKRNPIYKYFFSHSTTKALKIAETKLRNALNSNQKFVGKNGRLGANDDIYAICQKEIKPSIKLQKMFDAFDPNISFNTTDYERVFTLAKDAHDKDHFDKSIENYSRLKRDEIAKKFKEDPVLLRNLNRSNANKNVLEIADSVINDRKQKKYSEQLKELKNEATDTFKSLNLDETSIKKYLDTLNNQKSRQHVMEYVNYILKKNNMEVKYDVRNKLSELNEIAENYAIGINTEKKNLDDEKQNVDVYNANDIDSNLKIDDEQTIADFEQQLNTMLPETEIEKN